MEKTKGMFSEVKGEIIKVNLIYSFLDSIMLFFITYFIISFFNFKFLYVLAIPGFISLVFFTINFMVRLKKSRLKDMEDANPQLREILRTAHDNQDQNNFMVTALFDELKGKLKTSSSGKLLDPKKIMTRVVSAIVVVFLIVFLSSITLSLKKIDIPFEKLHFLTDKDDAAHQEGQLTDLVFNETNVIYGDASIAKLGNDVVNINVNPTMNDVDLSKTSDADQDRQLRSGQAPDEVSVTSDAYNNQKVLEEAEQAVNYSQRISKIS